MKGRAGSGPSFGWSYCLKTPPFGSQANLMSPIFLRLRDVITLRFNRAVISYAIDPKNIDRAPQLCIKNAEDSDDTNQLIAGTSIRSNTGSHARIAQLIHRRLAHLPKKSDRVTQMRPVGFMGCPSSVDNRNGGIPQNSHRRRFSRRLRHPRSQRPLIPHPRNNQPNRPLPGLRNYLDPHIHRIASATDNTKLSTPESQLTNFLYIYLNQSNTSAHKTLSTPSTTSETSSRFPSTSATPFSSPPSILDSPSNRTCARELRPRILRHLRPASSACLADRLGLCRLRRNYPATLLYDTSLVLPSTDTEAKSISDGRLADFGVRCSQKRRGRGRRGEGV